MCGQGDETVVHALFYCSFAHEVWRLSELGIRGGDVGRCVGDWWEGCLAQMEGEEMCEL